MRGAATTTTHPKRKSTSTSTTPFVAMPRSHRPADLTLNLRSANEPPGPNSSPIGVDLSSFSGDIADNVSADIVQLPPLPQSPPPPTSPQHGRDPSKNFLSNFKSRVSPDQDQRAQMPRSKVEDDEVYRPGSSNVSKVYHLRKNPGSTPELSLVGSAENVEKRSGEAGRPAASDARPQPSPHHSEDSVASRRKEKTFRNPLMRTKSRRDSHSKSRMDNNKSPQQPPKTAPISDWQPENEMIRYLTNKAPRGKSAERAAASESDDNASEVRAPTKEKEKEKKESSFKNPLKGKSGGGNIFSRLGGKIARSGSSSHGNSGPVPEPEYVCTTITLPLVDQTRITRISKDLDSCRDKTEYWMPALPWRCIDFLNQCCELQGLYRVPGSVPEVKMWRRRFDSEGDIDLLSEEINDPNNITSLLKGWLRDLPSDIMPKAAQDRLAEIMAEDNPNYTQPGQDAPDVLRNTLSELPPFNYYLLFAITCHLSLLVSQKEKNLMDLFNLRICIQPALGIEPWLFNYLVGDWRHCWQGCYTEKQYLEKELAWEEEKRRNGGQNPAPTELPSSRSEMGFMRSMGDMTSGLNSMVVDERAVSSSGSTSGTSKPASQYEDARTILPLDEMPPPRKAKSDPYRQQAQPNSRSGTPPRDFLSAPTDDSSRTTSADRRDDPHGPVYTAGPVGHSRSDSSYHSHPPITKANPEFQNGDSRAHVSEYLVHNLANSGFSFSR